MVEVGGCENTFLANYDDVYKDDNQNIDEIAFEV
jgi:hypothetical protein